MTEDINLFKPIITRLIKKQILLLGSTVALETARNIKGITVSEDGTVTDIDSNVKNITELVANAYIYLSGQKAGSLPDMP